MGANEKSDYQAEFFPDAVSEEERKLFLRNNFQGAQMEKKNVLKKLGKGGLLTAGLFSLLFAANASAGTYSIYDKANGVTTYNVELGSLDELYKYTDPYGTLQTAAIKLSNSGYATELAWIQSVLGMEYTTFDKIDPVKPLYEVIDNPTLAAFKLPSAPEYFFIKTGKVDSGYDHFLYKNNAEMLWGFVDSKDWGTDANIYKISHVGTTTSPVPVSAAAWLLGSGLVGLVGVRRKFRK